MTTTHNSEGDHLSSAHPSFWVVRKRGAIHSWHRTSRSAVKWLNDHSDTIHGWKVSKSYTVKVFYFNRATNEAFAPEMYSEHETFADAMDHLAGWIHKAWEWDRDNHPSPSGRQQAWERWHDVLALANIASITMIQNPAFTYRFGRLSPPEGKGHDLRIEVYPTPADVLDRKVMANRGCDA